ncbi:DUF3365 domain-containing protein [Phormidium sp. CLA17]|uniref:c-type heme family protein n=1 Tax=Leptolyngbya sp. Cla-17 TaxID=2803751 RepID=UPI0018D9C20F|nr:DUF3365 domain-containing protein [Leptolyngbya sp. Cla-17]MBM0741772.1 DUF3365 domain-containing protein [Leptolyngbya sp. Cla-17]
MKNSRLERKFNILLFLVFAVGVILIGSSLSIAMDYQIGGQAKLLIQTMNSVRSYTSNNIKPLLADQLRSESAFISETVPAFSAREVFENFTKNPEFQNYFYKEATLNPTNLEDQADEFEANLINQFRQDKNKQELSGYRMLKGDKLYYLAHPLSVSQPSCLQCHSQPDRAPKSQLVKYGSEHGFGWQLHEIVTAQTIYVPASKVLELGLKNLSLMIGLLVGLFMAMILVINFLLRRAVIHPIQQLTAIADDLSKGMPTLQQLERFQVGNLGRMTRSQDESGQLLKAFHRMAQEIFQREQHLKQINQVLQVSEAKERSRSQALENSLRQLKRMQLKLIQSEKMSSLGQLVAGIAHEINNPVNFIHGNISHISRYSHDLLDLVALYQHHYPAPATEIQQQADEMDIEFLQIDLLKVLASMQLGTDRIREIVLSLRNFSRLDEADIKAVDIHQGIDSTLMILQNRLKSKPKGGEIEVTREYGNLPLVECYPGQLNQVFMNLLVNAIDTLEEKMDRNVSRVANDALDESMESASGEGSFAIRIQTAIAEPNSVQITITDNGVGIPEEIQNQLFDPFFTTKSIGKGTGLGLSISHQIITEKHGGTLQCVSQCGSGTEFTIAIPIQQKSGKDLDKTH